MNKSNVLYLNQHIDIKTLKGSKDYAIVPDTINITFNFDIKSTDKTSNIYNNLHEPVVKKR